MTPAEARTRVTTALADWSASQEADRLGKRKPRRKPTNSEHTAQSRVVKWLRDRGHTVFAVPNAGRRGNGAAWVDEGLTAGAPDLVIATPPPIGGYTCAGLEMKRFHGGKI